MTEETNTPEGNIPEGNPEQATDRSHGADSDWRTQIPETLREDPLLSDIADIGALAEGYIGTNRLMAARIPIPGEDAPDEVRAEFKEKLAEVPGVLLMPEDTGDAEAMNDLWRKLGRPETPEEYQWDAPTLPGDYQLTEAEAAYDKQVTRDFLAAGHGLGLTGAQVKGVMDWYGRLQGDAIESRISAFENAEATLKKEWGGAFDHNTGIARAALREFARPEEAKMLEGEMGNNPALARILYEAGRRSLESPVLRGKGPDAPMTPVEIQDRLSELRASPAAANPRDPAHGRMVSEIERYTKMLTGE
uniref:Uncharacterized protein n=1 Tax=Candidatus Kentrum sp. UNK TaxID=2126344 RepID=A0A451ARE6_9GAMM|nr:MAG: hypothetical protein BECKUNK1418G_GA0071005_100540 [Candidatus Kentron sp. UNK]VFK68621.1 MAG: hypothetical protein BECKUNK1418H_GA0071006_100440 [Candidatus Kentron sp. UNK]